MQFQYRCGVDSPQSTQIVYFSLQAVDHRGSTAQNLVMLNLFQHPVTLVIHENQRRWIPKQYRIESGTRFGMTIFLIIFWNAKLL